MAQESTSSYQSIVKGTAVFGGVQVFNILIKLIQGKVIAVLLGPVGMGVLSLLTSTANMLQQVSSLGLNLSAVKDISSANEKRDVSELSKVILVFRRLLKITGLLGCFLVIVFSSALSDFAFGNKDYQWSFIILSVMLYFTTLSNGEISILQGCRQLKHLAMASVAGASVGLVGGIPCYYFWGIKGIVPAMIILAVSSYFFYRAFANKIPVEKVRVDKDSTLSYAKGMVSLGIVAVIASLLGSLTTYLINIFISNYGNISDVGLYQAATSISNQYVSIVFASMAVDYFPRLAAVSDNAGKVREIVNLQSEIVLLIVAPLVTLILLTAPILIRLLLSKEFLATVPLVRWMGYGILFKAISFPMGYIAFAKGDKKCFFWFEGVLGNVLTLIFNIGGYELWGVKGLGISFVVSYITSCFIYIILTRYRYSFKHSVQFLKLLLPSILLPTVMFIFSIYISGFYFYIGGSLCCIITCIMSFRELNKRLNIWLILKNRLGR